MLYRSRFTDRREIARMTSSACGWIPSQLQWQNGHGVSELEHANGTGRLLAAMNLYLDRSSLQVSPASQVIHRTPTFLILDQAPSPVKHLQQFLFLEL